MKISNENTEVREGSVVVELGAGMTGLAGLGLAHCIRAVKQTRQERQSQSQQQQKLESQSQQQANSAFSTSVLPASSNIVSENDNDDDGDGDDGLACIGSIWVTDGNDAAAALCARNMKANLAYYLNHDITSNTNDNTSTNTDISSIKILSTSSSSSSGVDNSLPVDTTSTFPSVYCTKLVWGESALTPADKPSDCAACHNPARNQGDHIDASNHDDDDGDDDDDGGGGDSGGGSGSRSADTAACANAAGNVDKKDAGSMLSRLRGNVDVVIASDCLFFEAWHDELITTLDILLTNDTNEENDDDNDHRVGDHNVGEKKADCGLETASDASFHASSGIFISVAPSRGGSLERFVTKATARGWHDVTRQCLAAKNSPLHHYQVDASAELISSTATFDAQFPQDLAHGKDVGGIISQQHRSGVQQPSAGVSLASLLPHIIKQEKGNIEEETSSSADAIDSKDADHSIKKFDSNLHMPIVLCLQKKK